MSDTQSAQAIAKITACGSQWRLDVVARLYSWLTVGCCKEPTCCILANEQPTGCVMLRKFADYRPTGCTDAALQPVVKCLRHFRLQWISRGPEEELRRSTLAHHFLSVTSLYCPFIIINVKRSLINVLYVGNAVKSTALSIQSSALLNLS